MGKVIGMHSHLYGKNSGIVKFNQDSNKPWIGTETLWIAHFKVLRSDKNMSKEGGNKAKCKRQEGKFYNFQATRQDFPTESPLMLFGVSLPF